ncbi:MAG: DUF4297 domain-containing protein [Kiritimatiellae bacterium]|nr:DUF4297 domain-containing protein [Kiritimatiellia bacterium]
MNIAEYYGNLPFDLSGSMSKNRFRMELLWGVSVMLDLMQGDQDFTVVFDYVCDVEIHYTDGLEFHQIKTHEPNAHTHSYSAQTLTKKQSKGSASSILGKLYALKKDGGAKVKLVLVSNVPLHAPGITSSPGEFCLAGLSNNERRIIESALQSELKITSVDMSRVFYLHTHLNLLEPESEIRGKLNMHFEKVKHCEPRHPNALYRLIVENVQKKACYEYSQQEYESILKAKGISRSDFSQMLDIHADNENNGIRQAEDFIKGVADLAQRRRYRMALAGLLKQMSNSSPLRKLEMQVARYLLSDGTGNAEDLLRLLNEKFRNKIPVEYSNEEKDLFFVIVMGRFEMGGYDHGNDF